MALLASCEDDGATPAGDTGVDADADAPDVPDAAEPVIADLEPISHAEAVALAEYARTLHVLSSNGERPNELLPVAWSMVNVACQDRAQALAAAMAIGLAADRPEQPLLDDRVFDADAALDLAESGRPFIGMINIVGPLTTRQSLVLPDETVLEGTDHLGEYWWSYHHGVVLNVDGEPRVVDLSTGDEPLSIDTWASGFVEASIACVPMSDPEWEKVFLYWLTAWGNLIPGPRPERLCGYTITPIFTFRVYQEPVMEQVLASPMEMAVVTGGFTTLLAEYDVVLEMEQYPYVLSRYQARTEAEMCAEHDPAYCDDL